MKKGNTARMHLVFLVLCFVCVGLAQDWQRTAGPYGLGVVKFSTQTPQIAYYGNGDAIYRTANGGQSWRLVYSGSHRLHLIAVDEHNADLAVISGGIRDIVVTTDGGATWRTFSTPDRHTGVFVSRGRVFVGSEFNLRWLYYSTDTCRTWIQISIPWPHLSYRPAFAEGYQSGVLYVDRLKTTDGGVNWFRADSGLSGTPNAIAVAPSSPNILYAASDSGLWKSTNAGEYWTRIAWADVRVRSVAVDPADPNIVYARPDTDGFPSGYGYVMRSTNGGVTWTQSSVFVYELDRIGIGCPAANTVWSHNHLSTDRGATWRMMGAGLPGLPFWPGSRSRVFAHDPRSPATIWAEGLKTTDGGQSWWQAGPSYLSFMAAQAGNPENLYVVDFDRLWRSINAGQQWSYKHLPVPFFATAFEPHPSNPDVVFVAKEAQIYKTTNAGGSWTLLDPGCGSYIKDMKICPDQPNRMFIAGAFGVFRSDDGGNSWMAKNDTIAADLRLASILLVDPRQNNLVYRSTGITLWNYRSSNYGETWVRIGGPSVMGVCNAMTVLECPRCGRHLERQV